MPDAALRLLPEGFLATWRAVIGGDPPSWFTETYGILAESFYFGPGQNDDPAEIRRGRGGGPKADLYLNWNFFQAKRSVDRALEDLASGLRRYARTGQVACTPRPARHHGGDRG